MSVEGKERSNIPLHEHAPRPNRLEFMSGTGVHLLDWELYCSTVLRGATPSNPPMAYSKPLNEYGTIK